MLEESKLSQEKIINNFIESIIGIIEKRYLECSTFYKKQNSFRYEYLKTWHNDKIKKGLSIILKKDMIEYKYGVLSEESLNAIIDNVNNYFTIIDGEKNTKDKMDEMFNTLFQLPKEITSILLDLKEYYNT